MDNQYLKKEYISRVNRASDYIESNIEKQFTLEEIASVANFSKFHFHRIFQAIIGETPFQFILRLRLERAATLIVVNPQESITEIAFKCGFTDTSVFSRNFKSHFKISASQYRKEKTSKTNFNLTDNYIEKTTFMSYKYFCPGNETINCKTNKKLIKNVEVKNLPRMTVAYLRHTGPYKGDEKLFEKLWNRLFAWAGPRGLVCTPDFKMLVIYHDDMNVTIEEKLRMSVCITIPPDTKVDGDIGKMQIDTAKYVVARFSVTSTEFLQAWEWVYGEWLPSSGYQPDDKPCFEIYPEEPKDGKFTVDICVPVKPM